MAGVERALRRLRRVDESERGGDALHPAPDDLAARGVRVE